MDFAGVAIVDEAAFLVIFACGTQGAIAAVAGPLVVGQVEVQVFGDAEAIFILCWHGCDLVHTETMASGAKAPSFASADGGAEAPPFRTGPCHSVTRVETGTTGTACRAPTNSKAKAKPLSDRGTHFIAAPVRGLARHCRSGPWLVASFPGRSRWCSRLRGWRSLLPDCPVAELPNCRFGLRRCCCPR